MLKKSISLLFALFVVFGFSLSKPEKAYALNHARSDGNFYYRVVEYDESIEILSDSYYNDEYSIDYTTLEVVDIPETIEGKVVTRIGEGAFASCDSLKTVNLPNSLQSIGYNAFQGCSSLESIVIPENVTSIENGVFTYCTSLKSVKLPDSLVTIGQCAFYDCSSLEEISLPKSMADVGGMISVSLFSGCKSLKRVRIPDGIVSIEGNAFADCESLTDITIPESVEQIGEKAFIRCKSLMNVTIPKKVSSIGLYAFGYVGELGWWGEKKEYQLNSDFCISCYKGTAGESYAVDNDIKYSLLEWHEPTEVTTQLSTATIEVSENTTADMVTSNNESGNNMSNNAYFIWIIVGAIIVFITIFVFVVMIVLRKKRKHNS